MTSSTRRASALAVHLRTARAERDREAAGRQAALAEVERLREEVVRLHARVQELEAAQEARAAAPRPRGLASLLSPTDVRAG